MKPKNTKIWLVMMIIPFPLLISISLVQIIVRMIIKDNENAAAILNIISSILGIGSAVLLVGIPFWLFNYIKATNYNKTIK